MSKKHQVKREIVDGVSMGEHVLLARLRDQSIVRAAPSVFFIAAFERIGFVRLNVATYEPPTSWPTIHLRLPEQNARA